MATAVLLPLRASGGVVHRAILLLSVLGCDIELYEWRDETIPEYTSSGWVVFSESANWMDPTRIRTWFEKPVVLIGFYSPADTRQTEGGMIQTRVVWATNPVVYHEDLRDTFALVVDCQRSMTGLLDDPIEWEKTVIGTPGDDLVATLCSKR